MKTKVLGQEKAISEIISFVNNPKKGKSLLLHGPPGTGKTMSVYQVAKEFGMDVFEVNSSHKRSPTELKNTVSQIPGPRSTIFKYFSFSILILTYDYKLLIIVGWF